MKHTDGEKVAVTIVKATPEGLASMKAMKAKSAGWKPELRKWIDDTIEKIEKELEKGKK